VSAFDVMPSFKPAKNRAIWKETKLPESVSREVASPLASART
jgi:hypothetical protein